MTDFEFDKFPQDKILALHKHLQIRGGRMTTHSIGVAVLGVNMTQHKRDKLARLLESEAERLDIEAVSVPGEEGLSWRRRQPEPELDKKPSTGRDWSLDGTIVQTALLVARELGRAGISGLAGGFPTTEMAKRVSDRIGDQLDSKHFARSARKRAGRWRDQIEAAYSEGARDRTAAIKEHELKTDVPNPNLPDEPDVGPVLVTSGLAIYEGMSLNGDGYEDLDDIPDDPLVAHVVELEVNLDEAEQRTAELEQELLEAKAKLEALEGASKAADVQTHQLDPREALTGLLGALEKQLATAVEGKDAAYREYTRLEVKAEELTAALAAASKLTQVLGG